MLLSAQGRKFQDRVTKLIEQGYHRGEAVSEAAGEDPAAHKAFIDDHQSAVSRGQSISLPRFDRRRP